MSLLPYNIQEAFFNVGLHVNLITLAYLSYLPYIIMFILHFKMGISERSGNTTCQI